MSGLERGIPSLFVDLKGLYVDYGKMLIVGEIVEGIVKDLEQDAMSMKSGAWMGPPRRPFLTPRHGLASYGSAVGVLLSCSSSITSSLSITCLRPIPRASRDCFATYAYPARNLHGESNDPEASWGTPCSC